jgi:hypothetical protein
VVEFLGCARVRREVEDTALGDGVKGVDRYVSKGKGRGLSRGVRSGVEAGSVRARGGRREGRIGRVAGVGMNGLGLRQGVGVVPGAGRSLGADDESAHRPIDGIPAGQGRVAGALRIDLAGSLKRGRVMDSSARRLAGGAAGDGGGDERIGAFELLFKKWRGADAWQKGGCVVKSLMDAGQFMEMLNGLKVVPQKLSSGSAKMLMKLAIGALRPSQRSRPLEGGDAEGPKGADPRGDDACSPMDFAEFEFVMRKICERCGLEALSLVNEHDYSVLEEWRMQNHQSQERRHRHHAIAAHAPGFVGLGSAAKDANRNHELSHGSAPAQAPLSGQMLVYYADEGVLEVLSRAFVVDSEGDVRKAAGAALLRLAPLRCAAALSAAMHALGDGYPPVRDLAVRLLVLLCPAPLPVQPPDRPTSLFQGAWDVWSNPWRAHAHVTVKVSLAGISSCNGVYRAVPGRESQGVPIFRNADERLENLLLLRRPRRMANGSIGRRWCIAVARSSTSFNIVSTGSLSIAELESLVSLNEEACAEVREGWRPAEDPEAFEDGIAFPASDSGINAEKCAFVSCGNLVRAPRLVCGACKRVTYCSKACQKLAWKDHGPPGTEWERVVANRPVSGSEILNKDFKAELRKRAREACVAEELGDCKFTLSFTAEELSEFKLTLSYDHFVQIDDEYFMPAATGHCYYCTPGEEGVIPDQCPPLLEEAAPAHANSHLVGADESSWEEFYFSDEEGRDGLPPLGGWEVGRWGASPACQLVVEYLSWSIGTRVWVWRESMAEEEEDEEEQDVLSSEEEEEEEEEEEQAINAENVYDRREMLGGAALAPQLSLRIEEMQDEEDRPEFAGAATGTDCWEGREWRRRRKGGWALGTLEKLYIDALGLRWESSGPQRPETGTEIFNERLAAAIREKNGIQSEFTKAELMQLEEVGLDLSPDTYIKVDDDFFRPAVDDERLRPACLVRLDPEPEIDEYTLRVPAHDMGVAEREGMSHKTSLRAASSVRSGVTHRTHGTHRSEAPTHRSGASAAASQRGSVMSGTSAGVPGSVHSSRRSGKQETEEEDSTSSGLLVLSLRVHTQPYADPVVSEEMSVYKTQVRELLRLLRDSHSAQERKGALSILTRMRPTQGLPSVVVELTEMIARETDPLLKRDALAALSLLAPAGNDRAIVQLLGALDDNVLEVRLSALEALKVIALRGDSRVIDVLLAKMEDWCVSVAEGVSSSLRPREISDSRLRYGSHSVCVCMCVCARARACVRVT